jgi:hypothetical protein
VVAARGANGAQCVCNQCRRQWAIADAPKDYAKRASSGSSPGPSTHPCVWRLVRTTGHPVECRLWTVGRQSFISVTFMGEALVTESHGTVAEAGSRVTVLRDRLLATGWRTADVAPESAPVPNAVAVRARRSPVTG